MNLAISPLDGRYQAQLTALAPVVSESGLMGYRLQVEATWLLHLAEHAAIDLSLNDASHAILTKYAEGSFPTDYCDQIKQIELRTNHDVKAVEYFLRQELTNADADKQVLAHIHFGCTSEDINNVAYALMLRKARNEVLLPIAQLLNNKLITRAELYADQPMLSRTHGQTATPTTLGKEFAVYARRLGQQLTRWQNVGLEAKMNGAVGAYNAHVVVYPEVDWQSVSQTFIEDKLGLSFNPLTTQIENHDSIVEYSDALRRF